MKQNHRLRELRQVFFNGLAFRNPALVAALGLYPIAACSSLKIAVAISLILVVQSLLAGTVMCAVGGFLPSWLRPGAALAASALCWVPAGLLAESYLPGALLVTGALGGLLLCNSMVLSRLNDYAPTHIFSAVAADALGCTLGYSLLLCGLSALREYLRIGQVWGSHAWASSGALGPAPGLPFFGLILLAFCAAAVQAVNARRAKHAGKRRVTRL